MKHCPLALQLIDGQLWCGQRDGIGIYSTDLQKQRSMTTDDIKLVYGIAAVDDDKVAVATNGGLVLVDKQGDTSVLFLSVYI